MKTSEQLVCGEGIKEHKVPLTAAGGWLSTLTSSAVGEGLGDIKKCNFILLL